MLNIGKVLTGSCDDVFGEYTTGDKIIIGEGYNWLVCKQSYNTELLFAQFDSEKEKETFIYKNLSL